jgi:ribA/ribD-fused uncharacterized protein
MIAWFRYEYWFLSNFGDSPIVVPVSPVIPDWMWEKCAPCVENAYQAAKYPLDALGKYAFYARTPGMAKGYGRKPGIRGDWNKKRLPVMWVLLITKFQQNPDLARQLIATGNHMLAEGSRKDTFWGQVSGVGENHLGLMLMEIRDLLRWEAGLPKLEDRV